ncbi:hypothetical protein IAD21_01865 [Abditibacteriota bacterium]|nr:hypothetical protein IAD21_01865 [Abditibacteriota bacterium]
MTQALKSPVVNLPRRLLDIETIYHEPNIEAFPRAREIFARFPDAERIEVPSHWNIPGLHGNEGNASDWLKIKRNVLVLGMRKSLKCEPNSRSSDFIAPSLSNGCASGCVYCVAEGTLISTPQGAKPVEQIREGDAVMSFDSSSGQLVTGRVSGLAQREVRELLEIEVGGKTLRVTAEHPLWTRRGWVKAGDLSEDDELLCDDSNTT